MKPFFLRILSSVAGVGMISAGVAPLPTKTGVPFGPMANWVETPVASVGVPSGPMTVGADVVRVGKPFDAVEPAGVVAESARLRSVLDRTRPIPLGPVVPGPYALPVP